MKKDIGINLSGINSTSIVISKNQPSAVLLYSMHS